ncbi:hypothetical protein [Niveispirillum sp. BGYR6]|uniref:hypothetical protein n=1 Tax=Niveispirillum sp. BGYR6 TaxID=2971249 RepID=UPI0022B95545|nr:hypothetical protein [Niveispirillum sp. BGYR6]MDG5495963.1 hypothetical protein [Niveispirillum sp. BGYR6]
MNPAPTLDLIWWITAIELPALAGLFWMVQQTRKENEQALDPLRRGLETTSAQLREALAAYKLEVAKNYASIADVKALEDRLTSHLLRIETKLDGRLADGGVR